MKHRLLYALSLLLISNCPALAESSRNSAGAANPVKLDSGNRSQAAQQRANATSAGTTAASTSSSSPASASANTATKAAVKRSGKAKSNKLVPPPPPDVMAGTGLQKAPAASTPAPAAAKKDDKLVTVGSAGPYNFTGKSREQFSNTFDWQPDDKNDNLTFKATYSQIGSGSPHFNWIRVTLGNRILATEQTLKGKQEFALDLTGSVATGTNQIMVLANGTPGAAFRWKLTTPKKVLLKSVNPDEVVVGQDLTLKGENFDPAPDKDKITLGKKHFQANVASATELKLRIPADFAPGEYLVKVTVDGLSSKELKVTVRGIPELTGTNYNGIPPGAQLVIFGKNFSKKIAENQVSFAGQNAEVVAASPEQLTVIVPNFYTGMDNDTGGIAGQVGIPIKVKVGKIESKNTVPINVGNSMWTDPGLKTGPDLPSVPVDWRRLLEN